MNKELRIEKLKEIRDKGLAEETGIPLPYQGKTMKFESHKIPLNYLLYNKKNGRIASRVKSYETQKEEIDVEKDEGKKLIEKFIWEAHLKDNKQTEESIAVKGQLVRGIVTTEGIIIDGNRRASILNKIYFEREKWGKKKPKVDVNHAKYFVAIILPDDVTDDEIEELELATQFGEESKVDYNPIEKYLKVKDFDLKGKSTFDIAGHINKDVKEICLYLERMNLMDQYLLYLECEGIYTQLDGREDLFIHLNDTLKKLKRGIGVNWSCNEIDINEFKIIAFDYIRKKHEGKESRYLLQLGRKNIFGRDKSLWDTFKTKHFESMKDVREDTIEETLEKYPGDETKALTARDIDWAQKVEKNLDENMQDSIRTLEDLEDADKPEKLIKKAMTSINSINVSKIFSGKSKIVKKLLKGLIEAIQAIYSKL